MMESNSRLKVLACVVHYFGGARSSARNYKADYQDPSVRRSCVETCLASISRLAPAGGDVELTIEVCGKRGFSLVDLSVELEEENPRDLISATIDYMQKSSEHFDYFLLLEDDIEINDDLLRNTIAFDSQFPLNEALHPNRLEHKEGTFVCVDERAQGGWSTNSRPFVGFELRLHSNPHSGLFVLSKEKFLYCSSRADLSFRYPRRISGFPGGPMASAFANFLGPIYLLRPYPAGQWHSVLHLDHWEANLPSTRARVSQFIRDWIPPALTRFIGAFHEKVRSRDTLKSSVLE